MSENYFVGMCCKCGKSVWSYDLEIKLNKPQHKDCDKREEVLKNG